MKISQEQKEEKFATIRRWEESGLTQQQFCIQESISFNNFYYWLKKYRGKESKPVGRPRKESGKFINIQSQKGPVFSGAIFAEITFASGNCIKFYQAIELSHLKQLAI